ncbi:hypothetical protein [Bacillus sp. NPDC077027]|uniref:hypothetical protein n=1 Tax=Bacillus sp. NPDC077027 TaxID=3390548 RepID=UPI003D07168B
MFYLKKSIKAITMSLAAFGALTLFSAEGAHAAPASTSPVASKAPISAKTIVLNDTLRVGYSIAYSLPASSLSVTGNVHSIRLEQTAPNFTWLRAVSPGTVRITYYNSQGELVINNITVIR